MPKLLLNRCRKHFMLINHSTLCLFILAFQSTVIYAQNTNKKTLEPRIFEAGKISTEAVEYALTFSVSGQELYFARSKDSWGTGNMKSTIYHAIKRDNHWSIPKPVPFSGQYDDSDPHLAHDGQTLYFISKRPSETEEISADIWKVIRDHQGNWGHPVRLNDSINSKGNEYSPQTDMQGNLYFASDRDGGYGQGDLYVTYFKNGKLRAPVNMGGTINTSTGEWNLGINSKGDLLIFEASQRKQNVSSYGDLYISFRQDQKWSIPRNIKELNSSGSDLYPYLTRYGHQLCYTSSDSLKSKVTNIYCIQIKDLLEAYRKKARVP